MINRLVKSLMSYAAVILLLISAVCVKIFIIPDEPIQGIDPILGAEQYEWRTVQAPVLMGSILDALSRLSTGSKLGPVIRRILLNDNNIHILRELSSQVTLPPMYHPIRRISFTERKKMENAANSVEGSLDRPLRDGFGNLYKEDSNVCPTHAATVSQFYSVYKSKKKKPSDIMARTIKAVRAWESRGLKIFSSFLEADIMQQAYESDARFANGSFRSIFEGVPVAFKDTNNILGHKIYDGRNPSDPLNIVISDKDDTTVARFRALGAIILGATIMTEGGVTPLGYNAHFQGPHSAFSSYRYSGGSSAGSGVAVATGLVPIAVGFDSGGSIRIPASMSGVHGLATTFHRCPFDNNTFQTLLKTGPIAASAEDAALAYAVMAPSKEGHFFTTYYDGGVQGPPPPHLRGFSRIEDLSDVRLGVFPEWFDDSDTAVRDLCNDALQYLISKGATVVNITIPHLPWLSLAHGIKIASEFALAFDKHLHTRYDSLEPNTRITVGIGATVTALEVLAAERMRAWAFEHVQGLFASNNLTAIVTPTLPLVAPVLHPAARSHGESNTALVMQIMKYVFLANFLGMPGYSVPVGFAAAGQEGGEPLRLPVGLHLLGNHWHDEELLRLANALDKGHTPKGPGVQPLFHFDPFASE